MTKRDAQDERIAAILGDDEDMDLEACVSVFFKYLKAHLQFPCQVTGCEDFQWEEPYVIGGWDRREYERLKKTQPSYEDRYELLDIEQGVYSEWMLFRCEDIAARVRRISDGKKFILGLAELKATDKKSPNCQLIDDFACWFVNER
jgi:hypothetical protein